MGVAQTHVQPVTSWVESSFCFAVRSITLAPGLILDSLRWLLEVACSYCSHEQGLKAKMQIRGVGPGNQKQREILAKSKKSSVARAKPSASTSSQQNVEGPASRDVRHAPLPRAPGANDRRAGSLGCTRHSTSASSRSTRPATTAADKEQMQQRTA